MEKQLYKEELLYSVDEPWLSEEAYSAIQSTIYHNHAVGFIAGYYDENLTIAYISEFFLHNLGYSYEEFMNRTSGSLKKVVYGDDCAYIDNDRFRYISGKGEMQMLSGDGVVVTLYCYKKDTVDAKGTPLWILSTHMDQMQENLKLVSQVIKSGFWSVEFDRMGEYQSIHYSHEFRTMLGYHDTLDFPNRLDVWDEAIYPDDRERVREAFYGAIRDKTNQTKYNVKYRMRLADGSYEWFQDSAEITRRMDGTAYRMAGIFVNIDKEEKLLQYTRQVDKEREELSEKNRRMDLLIQGTTKLVDRYAACDLEHDFYQFYSQSMSDSAYAPAGAYHEFVAANLSDLCDNLVSMTKVQTDIHHHEFNVHINQIEHEDVCGDSMRIQQLVTNILSNAVKYTPDGGRIDFTIREVPTNSKGLGCYEFVVQDNGIGMSKEFQKILFEPFARADDKRTTKIQGTGLGMTIAKNFAQMMNGNIKVESEVGKGSRFTITIFLKHQNKEIEALDELINLPVLVVDDDRSCCETTVALLEEIGLNGEWVTSGAEAVERAAERYERNDNYFAIIIDWQMPGMDGIETTRQIRKRVGKDVTIIILSAYDYGEIEQEAREAGVDEFISKPLFRSRLTATLKNIVQGKPSAAARHYLSDIASCDYSGKRILLVEDNDLNREVAQEIIGMTGAEVATAENGRDAVEMLAKAKDGEYDLVFMDIQMPVMNGYEATAAIRSLHKQDGKNIPIVAMTANAFAEDILLAKNAGMNEHISKPLDMTRLRDVLRRWL